MAAAAAAAAAAAVETGARDSTVADCRSVPFSCRAGPARRRRRFIAKRPFREIYRGRETRLCMLRVFSGLRIIMRITLRGGTIKTYYYYDWRCRVRGRRLLRVEAANFFFFFFPCVM